MKLKWNEPKELPSGKYVKSTNIQDDDMEEFWEIWNNKKEQIKESGFSIKKYNEKWQLNYWPNNDDLVLINKNCNELCNKFGFIENKNKKDEILNFLNSLQDEFINNNCIDLFTKINEKIESIFDQ